MPELTLSPDYVPLKEVLHDMEQGKRFDISYVKCDLKRGTGGEIKTLLGCMVLRHTPRRRKNQVEAPTAEQISKNPHHYQNSTRNIQHLQTGDIYKMHVRLILTYNGKKVL